ncbi:tRNA-uridine aminocarboxypropyltransferase [Pseudocolwellia sp. HL-MZ19]|uniref:tRNA-uridine aminocarboxypropyltransferase n=1 Tax=Pseudocolwellia sp. HL-MZ19 TaxID=3400846 RepID=UPI003CEC4D53
MKRQCCSVCLRAKVGCICHLFTEINNEIHVVVLQHPTEVSQTKGTVTLLANSLTNCDIIIGENFSGNEAFVDILSRYENDIVLLYPSENAEVIASTECDPSVQDCAVSDSNTLDADKAQKQNSENTENNNARSPKCIILIDGTWKKSYKMYMLNEALHHIPHLTLPDHIQGDYRIRKTQKEQALSSLEACTYALLLLENDANKYQPLLNSFSQFNDFQLSFKPNN